MELERSQEAAPVHKLYRHTLETIFGFCAIKDLSALLAVSRAWSAAVCSMAPIRGIREVDSVEEISRLASSRLSRHIMGVFGECVCSPEGSRVLVDQMPWIQEYQFVWPSEQAYSDEQAQLLSRLRKLQVLTMALYPAEEASIKLTDEGVARVNHLITVVGGLEHLETFELNLRAHDQRILFAPLAALERLKTFTLYVLPGFRSALPSDEQVAALRQMHALERFDHTFTGRNGTLRLLAQSPIRPLRWVVAIVASGASDVLPLLQSLPSLTELDVECGSGDAEFLASFPRVTTLSLHQPDDEPTAESLARIVPNVQRCPQLTSLNLYLAFTSEQLSVLLPCLPCLSQLTLSSIVELTSLSFLSTEALAASLTALDVWGRYTMPPDEIVHLLGLRSLRELNLDRFSDSLTESHKEQIQAVFPFADLWEDEDRSPGLNTPPTHPNEDEWG